MGPHVDGDKVRGGTRREADEGEDVIGRDGHLEAAVLEGRLTAQGGQRPVEAEQGVGRRLQPL